MLTPADGDDMTADPVHHGPGDTQWTTDYRTAVYPNGRRVIVHRSGLTAVMNDRTGKYLHGVRPVYDGWMDTMEWMDMDPATGHPATGDTTRMGDDRQ